MRPWHLEPRSSAQRGITCMVLSYSPRLGRQRVWLLSNHTSRGARTPPQHTGTRAWVDASMAIWPRASCPMLQRLGRSPSLRGGGGVCADGGGP